jgi:hypothetical protein
MYKFLGTTEENTTCDCCGKRNLKKTIVLENESGNIVYFGSDCAALAITGNKKNNKVMLDIALGIQFVKDNFEKYSKVNHIDWLITKAQVKGLNCWVEKKQIRYSVRVNGKNEVAAIMDIE